MKKRILTVVVGILCAVGMHGQSSGVPSLPQLATPSPKATMIDRFGYYPTNLYTGLVDITIPIHTIEVKGIKIPIEFKYHASGLKYDDLPMEVGYGWTLMAGGTVSYSARGAGIYRPNGNEISPFIKYMSEIALNDKNGSPNSDQLQLEYVANGSEPYKNVDYYRDSEYDVYNFSFPGHCGQHYALSDGTRFTTPSGVVFFNSGFNPTAKDEYGNTYEFNLADVDSYYKNFTSYLTRIVSADRKDTVNFVYTTFGWGESKSKRPVIDNSYVIKTTTPYNSSFAHTEFEHKGSFGITYKEFNSPVLAEINHKGGKVKFIYSSTSKRSLEQINIMDQTGALIRSVALEKTNHSYLNAVNFQDRSKKNIYSYRFEYNGTKPEITNPRIDYWGYYTNTAATSGNLYVPNFTVSIPGYSSGYTIPGMDRSPNETGMQLGILKKIVYPTKGYSTFTYEGHRANSKLYGGLRIKEVKNYDEGGNLLESKWYKYGRMEDGNGRTAREIYSDDYVTPFYDVQATWTSGAGSGQVVGDRILSKTYTPFPKCSYFTQGSTVVYPYVTEYVGSPTGNYGKTVYQFTDFQDPTGDRTMRGYATEIPMWSYAWKNGKLLSKTVMDDTGKMVYHLDNTYEEINQADHLNLRVSLYCKISDGNIERIFTDYPNFADAIGGSLHDYYNYYITSGDYVVKESRESKDGVTRIIRYRYNDLGQVTEEAQIRADGDTFTTRYYYPYDAWKDGTGTPVQSAMNQKNMFAPVLAKSVYKGGLLVDEVKNEYKDWGDFIALQNVKQLNYYEPRIKYQSYDKYGNPTRISKDGEFEDVSYIWGHQGQRVVAEIRGGSFSALGQTLIDRVTSAVSPSSADMAAIEALRNNHSLEGSRITTYYYDSALNLEQLVMPNGTKTNYEYDSFGRLSCVKDHNGKVIESYQYNYKQ